MNQPAWPFPNSRSVLEAETFQGIFRDLRTHGKICSPRNLRVIELEHYTFKLPPYVRFCSFKARKLNLNYIKNEFLWYLRGDKHDTSIGDKAKLWQSLVNADGSINSNYGQYIFAGSPCQFDLAVNQLLSDKDSRRAAMVILADRHLSMDTKDMPCTYSLGFRIRDDQLNMSVHMRSQDAIFGMGNDVPCFSFIHEMVFTQLRSVRYPELKLGSYYHTADSFHLYERHFGMLEVLAEGDLFETISCPEMSNEGEVKELRELPHMYRTVGSIPPVVSALRESFEDNRRFTNWLYTEE